MTNSEPRSYRPVFLNGKQVYLRPIEKEDLPILQVWANDPMLRGLTGDVLPTSFSGIEAYVDKIAADSDRVWFGIVLKETNQLIGECGLLRMFPAWRTTDLSIILGDKEARGKGFGREAMHLLLDYAFGYLNFHRVSIGVVGMNEQALRFYEQAGFIREGIQRDGYFYNHRYQDFVMLSMLEDEFRAHVWPGGS
ncbi:MAG: N-acetyltransferase [Chloroflexi bacterium HGW-Chloroflexi-10]|nr:MAG: N-acetyltransferase [Chloroflexi bacterium HGW-Chloroflexi-10]